MAADTGHTYAGARLPVLAANVATRLRVSRSSGIHRQDGWRSEGWLHRFDPQGHSAHRQCQRDQTDDVDFLDEATTINAAARS
jgi:hypothetical protein